MAPPEADLALRKLASYEHNEAAKVYHFKDATWRQVPQREQRDGADRQCFKPRLRQKWDTVYGEQALERP